MSLWSRLFRSSASEHYQKGIRYFNEGDYDRAVEYLERVVTGEKSRDSAIAKLGAFYAAEAHSKLGMAEFYRGKLDRARSHFKTALGVNPHYPDLYYYLGVVYHQKNDLDSALEHLTKAVELNSEYAEATCYLGITLHDAGFFEQASQCFTRALELSRIGANPLSRLLVEKLDSRYFEHPQLQELKHVVMENSSFQNQVKEGNDAFNRGDYDQAVVCFGEAARLKPGYADLQCRLGFSRHTALGSKPECPCSHLPKEADAPITQR